MSGGGSVPIDQLIAQAKGGGAQGGGPKLPPLKSAGTTGGGSSGGSVSIDQLIAQAKRGGIPTPQHSSAAAQPAKPGLFKRIVSDLKQGVAGVAHIPGSLVTDRATFLQSALGKTGANVADTVLTGGATKFVPRLAHGLQAKSNATAQRQPGESLSGFTARKYPLVGGALVAGPVTLFEHARHPTQALKDYSAHPLLAPLGDAATLAMVTGPAGAALKGAAEGAAEAAAASGTEQAAARAATLGKAAHVAEGVHGAVENVASGGIRPALRGFTVPFTGQQVPGLRAFPERAFTATQEGSTSPVTKLAARLSPQSHAVSATILGGTATEKVAESGQQRLGIKLAKILPERDQQAAAVAVGEKIGPTLAGLRQHLGPDEFAAHVTDRYKGTLSPAAANLAADIAEGKAPPELVAKVHEFLSTYRDAPGGQAQRTEAFLAKPGHAYQAGYEPNPAAVKAATDEARSGLPRLTKIADQARTRADAARAAADRAAASEVPAAKVDVRAGRLVGALRAVEAARTRAGTTGAAAGSAEEALVAKAEGSVPTLDQANANLDKEVAAERAALRRQYVDTASKASGAARTDMAPFFTEGPLQRFSANTQPDWYRNLPDRVRNALHSGVGLTHTVAEHGGIGPDEFIQAVRRQLPHMEGLTENQIADHFTQLYDRYAAMRKAPFHGFAALTPDHLRNVGINDPYLESLLGDAPARVVAQHLADTYGGPQPPTEASLAAARNTAVGDAGNRLVAAQQAAEDAYARARTAGNGSRPTATSPSAEPPGAPAVEVREGGEAPPINAMQLYFQKRGLPGVMDERTPGIHQFPLSGEGEQGQAFIYHAEDGKPVGYLVVRHPENLNLSDDELRARYDYKWALRKPKLLVNVDEAYRRQGIASQLYKAAEDSGIPIEDISGHYGTLTPAAAAFRTARLQTGTPQPVPPALSARAELVAQVSAEHGADAAKVAARHFDALTAEAKVPVTEAKVPAARGRLTTPLAAAGEKVGATAMRARVLGNVADSAEARVGKLVTAGERAGKNAEYSIENAPARLKPVLGENRAAAQKLVGVMNDLNRRGLPDAAKAVEDTLAKLPTDLKGLEKAGIDAPHFFHTQELRPAKGGAPRGITYPGQFKPGSEKLRTGSPIFDRTVAGQVRGGTEALRAAVRDATVERINNLPGITARLGEGPLRDVHNVDEALAKGYKPTTAMTFGGNGRVKALSDLDLRLGVTSDTRFIPTPLFDEFRNYFEPRRYQLLGAAMDPLNRVSVLSKLALSPAFIVGRIFGHGMLALAGTSDPAALISNLVDVVRQYHASGGWGERSFDEISPPRLLKSNATTAEYARMVTDAEPGNRKLAGTRGGQAATAASGKLTSLGNKLIAKPFKLASFFDDAQRTAFYLTEKTKLGDEAALEATLRMTGEYDRATPFERDAVRRIIPFWQWHRELTRIAFHLAEDHPLRVAWTLHLSNLASQPDTSLPDRYAQGVKVGGNVADVTYLNPFNEVGSAFGPTRTLGIGKIAGPGARLLFSTATGENPSTGRPYSRPPGTGQDNGHTPTAPSVLRQLTQPLPQKRLFDSLTGADRVKRYDTGQPILAKGGRTKPAVPVSRLSALTGFAGVPFTRITDQQKAQAAAAAAGAKAAKSAATQRKNYQRKLNKLGG